MDIYTKRSNFKIALLFIGLILLAISVGYSGFLAKQLQDKEVKDAERYVLALETLNKNTDLDQDIELEESIITSADIQVVYQTDDGFLGGMNWGMANDTNQVFLEEKIQSYIDAGKAPLKAYGYSGIYPFNSKLMTYIRFFPILQGLLVALFIALAYFLFNSSKNAEQNRVWAGMAKETAHQLGTPISAILAWIEHLKLTTEDPEQLEIIGELIKDVDRLELVADRFSKIGSAPLLQKTNIVKKLDDLKIYMKRRSSKGIDFDFPSPEGTPIYGQVNGHLFDWVIENLIRNALDAMDGKGQISANVLADDEFVTINLKDTGKGIPSSKFKTVFQPGFSTKTRGWGLGLSLAKRIIESYHKGKIFVKNSKINEGTTFTIKIPKAV